jgi:hypothetical protein
MNFESILAYGYADSTDQAHFFTPLFFDYILPAILFGYLGYRTGKAKGSKNPDKFATTLHPLSLPEGVYIILAFNRIGPDLSYAWVIHNIRDEHFIIRIKHSEGNLVKPTVSGRFQVQWPDDDSDFATITELP